MLRRRGSEPTDEPPADPRYEGKPMLALLEDYVRWSISAIPAEREAYLQQLVPVLRAVRHRRDDVAWVRGGGDGLPRHPSGLARRPLPELRRRPGRLADGTLDLTSWVQTVVDQNFT